MQETSMAGMEAETEAPCACLYARLSGSREILLIFVLLCALAKTNEALADSKCCDEFAPAPRGSHPLSLEAPKLDILKTHEFSPTEFRPRPKDELRGFDARGEELPSLKATNVWQRLSEYRAAHNRIRLVTLWETQGSSLSLQAGKRGEPSLQWTSHTGGGPGRGLLDHVIAASLGSLMRSHGAAPKGALTPSAQAASP
jgi:hypothetical protein